MKSSSALLILASLAGTLVPAQVFGQERVRLTLPLDTLLGVVTRMSADEVELSLEGGGSRVFLREEVLRMERGTEHSQGHVGFLLGSVAGFSAGLASLFWLYETDYFNDTALQLGPALGLIGGGIAGHRIGASKKRVKWETVPDWTVFWMMPERLRDPGDTRDESTGLRVGAAFRVGVKVRFR